MTTEEIGIVIEIVCTNLPGEEWDGNSTLRLGIQRDDDVLISNVEDGLRNHGFLWLNKAGWPRSPACDLNPVPTESISHSLSRRPAFSSKRSRP